MANATFEINPLGRVAGGVEGSGQAQYLKPYDATKFQRAEDAQAAAKQKDNYQKLKDARALKLKELEDLKTPWQEDTNFYSQELEDLRKAMVANEMQFNYNNANIKDPDKLYAANSIVLNNQANLNDQAQSLNTEIDYGWQNQKIWEDALNTYKGDTRAYDPSTNARLTEFSTLEGREDLVKELGVQGARRELLKEYGGTILRDRFDPSKYQAERQNVNKSFYKSTTTGYSNKDIDKGLIYYNEETKKVVNIKDVLDGELNSLSNYEGYQDWVKEQYSDSILAANPNAKTIDDVSKEQLMKWAKESPDYLEHVKTYMPGDLISYKSRATQTRESSAGAKVLTDDELKSSTDMSNINLPYEPWLDTFTSWTDIKKRAKEGDPTIQKSALYGGHNLTNADVTNNVDAVGVSGTNTIYEDPLTGERIDVEGSYTILNPGLAGVKKKLVSPLTYKGIKYEAGDYISEEMANNLSAGKDYQSVYTNTIVGKGQTKSRTGDKTIRKNAEFIGTMDYLEDTHLTAKTKQTSFENERNAVTLDLNNVIVKTTNTNISYNANDIVNSWAKEIGGGTITPESYRQATDEYYDAVKNGDLKLQ